MTDTKGSDVRSDSVSEASDSLASEATDTKASPKKTTKTTTPKSATKSATKKSTAQKTTGTTTGKTAASSTKSAAKTAAKSSAKANDATVNDGKTEKNAVTKPAAKSGTVKKTATKATTKTSPQSAAQAAEDKGKTPAGKAEETAPASPKTTAQKAASASSKKTSATTKAKTAKATTTKKSASGKSDKAASAASKASDDSAVKSAAKGAAEPTAVDTGVESVASATDTAEAGKSSAEAQKTAAKKTAPQAAKTTAAKSPAKKATTAKKTTAKAKAGKASPQDTSSQKAGAMVDGENAGRVTGKETGKQDMGVLEGAKALPLTGSTAKGLPAGEAHAALSSDGLKVLGTSEAKALSGSTAKNLQGTTTALPAGEEKSETAAADKKKTSSADKSTTRKTAAKTTKAKTTKAKTSKAKTADATAASKAAPPVKPEETTDESSQTGADSVLETAGKSAEKAGGQSPVVAEGSTPEPDADRTAAEATAQDEAEGKGSDKVSGKDSDKDADKKGRKQTGKGRASKTAAQKDDDAEDDATQDKASDKGEGVSAAKTAAKTADKTPDKPEQDAKKSGKTQQGKTGQTKTQPASRTARRKMFVSVMPEEQIEVVITEEGQVQEYYVEMLQQQKTKGNIYKATIHNIDANLQAAFVNYGANKNGFLQIDEVHPEYYNVPHDESSNRRYPPIQKVLKPGQELLVQVVKEPNASKGAFLTTYLSLAGRFLVLTPGREQIGVSRKVDDGSERERLREMLEDFKPGPGLGVIVRTVSMGMNKATLKKDLQSLKTTWEKVRELGVEEKAPKLIYEEIGLATRSVRDYLTDQIVEVWLDDPETAKDVEELVSTLFPKKNKLVHVHTDFTTSLFERFNVQRQLDQIQSREVPLPSGGRLVIDTTEALTAIDINSGRSGGKSSFEDTAFRTNMEAAKMIPLQLRLRDIGGQVVCDFIEMRDKAHWREVEKTVRAAMKVDRARHDVGRISSFGLLELVRQRLGSSAISVNMEVCPHCKGSGVRRNLEWQSQQALKEIARRMRAAKEQKQATITYGVDMPVAMYLLNNKRQRLNALEEKLGITVEITLGEQE